MVSSKNRSVPTCNIYLDNEEIKQIQEFENLGSIVKTNSKCDKDKTLSCDCKERNHRKEKQFYKLQDIY